IGHRYAGLVHREVIRHDFLIVVDVAPTRFVRTREHRVIVDARELPRAVLAHVLVLVDTAGPFGSAAEAAGHRPFPPAALGRLPVGRYVDQRPEDELRVEASGRQAVTSVAERLEKVFADRFLAGDAVVAAD